MVDRRSPTPPHNTAQFETWIGFAAAMKGELADYPKTPDLLTMCRLLDEYERRFTEWKNDEAKRPAPSARTEHVLKFTTLRGEAIDMLTRLAREYPEIAQAALERHRREFERLRKEKR